MKYFTVEEANSLIPKLETLLLKLRSKQVELDSFKPVIDTIAAKSAYPSRNGGHAKGLGYAKTMQDFVELINQLNSYGCVLKDIPQGLVDFPAIRDGREVYFCWKLGETEIEFWHELDTGFIGRKPI